MDYVHESVTVVDTHNRSHPRPLIPTGYKPRGKEASSDDIDESSCRTFKPVLLDENDSDEPRSRDCRSGVEVKCSQIPMGGTQTQIRRYQTEMGASIDESSSRPNRCFVSTHQQMEQPETPVRRGGCVESTRVNMHDIDECFATNKCKCGKQDSNQTRNKWLTSTFSMLTSSVWGKSKAKIGEAVTENASTNSKSLVLKPEFNFFL